MKRIGFLQKLLCTFVFLFSVAGLFLVNVRAQGLNIPDGATLDINNAHLSVSGGITISGTFSVTKGKVWLNGDWNNSSGTFMSGSSTVIFNGTETQTVSAGGLDDDKVFFNFSDSGVGDIILSGSGINIDNDFMNTAGTFNAAGFDMTIAGDWSAIEGSTFLHGSNTVTLDGSQQSIMGSTTFWALNKRASVEDTLTFDSTGEQIIENFLILRGRSVNKLLSLVSNVPSNRWRISLPVGKSQDLNFLRVTDSDASAGLMLVGHEAIDGGNNAGWTFGAVTVTWEGDISTDWGTPNNWDLGFVPTPLDSVNIPALANQPSLVSVVTTSVTVENLVIASGASLMLAGKDFRVNDALLNDGTIYANGSEDIVIETSDLDSGNFVFGDTDNIVETPTIANIKYFDLTINDINGEDTYQTDEDLTIFGELKIVSGILDISTEENKITVGGTITLEGGDLFAVNGNIDLNSDLVITAGTFTAPTATHTLNISGDFFHNIAGTFKHSNGTVVFDGSQQNILGDQDNTFYELNKTVTVPDTMIFSTIAKQMIIKSLVLRGSDSNTKLSLRSATLGTQFSLSLEDGGFQDLAFLTVGDSDASLGLRLVARNSNEDPVESTNNWAFNSTTVVWNGDISTDWNITGNWGLGLLPIVGDSVIIPAVSTHYPVLSANTSLVDVTIDANAQLDLLGFDLNIDNVLSLEGSIHIVGSEIFTVGGSMDGDSGTIFYYGSSNGVSDVYSIRDVASLSGSIDYYNLVIKTGDTPFDIFRTNGDVLVENVLTLSAGVLDISTNGDVLTINNTLLIDGGHLIATGGEIYANADILTSSGSLIAPNGNGVLSVAGDWSLDSQATFKHSSGRVILDTSNSISIKGNTTFFDLKSSVRNKVITFESGSIQTIDTGGSVIFNGGDKKQMTLKSSSSGGDWILKIPDIIQVMSFVSISDLEVETTTGNNYDVYCFACEDAGGTDGADDESTAKVNFSYLGVTEPIDTSTTDSTPTLIGVALPNQAVTLRVGSRVVGTTIADTLGNWRFEVQDTDSLSLGTTGIRPYVNGGTLGGATTFLTIVEQPLVEQQPMILTPQNLERISGHSVILRGEGKPGQLIEVKARDALGNLTLTIVGEDIVSESGTYAVVLTKDLPKGSNYVSVTVDGVASDIYELLFTDPYGVIFDGLNDNLIEGAEVSIFTSFGTLAVPGTHIHPTDVNPVIVGDDGFYSFLTVPGDYTINVNVPGFTYPSQRETFPSGREVILGSKGERFTVSSTIINMDHPMDAVSELLRIEKTANKLEARIGEVVTYAIDIEAISKEDNVFNIRVLDKIPPGFKYIKNHVTLDGVAIADPIGSRDLIFEIGDIVVGSKKVLKYQLLVGSGVTYGEYSNLAVAFRSGNGGLLSNRSTAIVKVIMDPLFDMGTILGKVFYDVNQNGIQDVPYFDIMKGKDITEDPIGGVKIVMEDGTVITADANGLFSVPGILPGRHLLRIDERSLSPDSRLTTPKVVVVDVTPGSTYKVNFGIFADYEVLTGKHQKFFATDVGFSQSIGKPKPKLNIDFFGKEAVIYNNILIEPMEFRVFMNYAPFVESWKLDIVDVAIKKSIQTFEGSSLNVFDPIYWDGKDKDGEYISVEREYGFVYTVYGNRKRYNTTQLKRIPLKVIETDEEFEIYQKNQKEKNKRKGYRRWVVEQTEIDYTDINTILIDGETITMDLKESSLYSIQIVRNNTVVSEIPIAQSHGLTAREILETGEIKQDKRKPIDVILPRGDYDIIVQTAKDVISDLGGKETLISDLNTTSLVSGVKEENSVYSTIPDRQFIKHVRVGDDQMFFVGLGDAKIGYNFTKGNIEPIAQEDSLDMGFWRDGKLAYYLQGKIKGKYLITSSFDSDRERKEIFRRLDPDQYYSVYGDQSKVDYESADTQGNLYVALDWDKSSVKWGNYSVGFDDTEFGRYTRSFYGAKIDFESIGTTRFGEARTKAIVFRAKTDLKSAHNEFLATGGSLYYSKHKDVIQGSDQVKIEVRDRVTGIVLSSRELVEGADYEMDYKDGRLLFWRPLPVLVDVYSIIDNDLLDGNLVYLVMDYEYSIARNIEEANYGVRLRQALTDNVVAGVTAVTEHQEKGEYSFTATDVSIQANDDTKVVAEYAQTQSDQKGVFISTDGGLSFTELQTDKDSRGIAYSIKGNTKLFNNLLFNAGYRWVENDFSSSATASQQGKELTNFEAIYDGGGKTRITARHDIQALIEHGNAQTRAQVGAEKITTSLVQLIRQTRNLQFTMEYLKTVVTEKVQGVDTSVNREKSAVAVKADYKLGEKIDLSLRQQITIDGEQDNQTTFGIVGRPTDKITIKAEKTIGVDGFTGDVDVRVDTEGAISFVGGYKLHRAIDGTVTQDKSGDATAGIVLKVNQNTEIKTELGLERVFDKDPIKVVKVSTKSSLGKENTVETQLALRQGVDNLSTAMKIKGLRTLGEDNQIEGDVTLSTDGDHQESVYAVRMVKKIDENTELKSQIVVDGPEDNRRTSMSFIGKKQVSENIQTTSHFKVTDSPVDGKLTGFTLGTKEQINKELQLVSSTTFEQTEQGDVSNKMSYSLLRQKNNGESLEGKLTRNLSDKVNGGNDNEYTYSLIRQKDGKRLEGSLTTRKSSGEQQTSSSNIFGLSGDVNDKLAFEGNVERSNVQNLDGSKVDRDVFSVALGYVDRDEETGRNFKSSTKLELRRDRASEKKRQVLIHQSIEGKLNHDLTLAGKVQLSETRNTTKDIVEAEHKELEVGVAYRPVMQDRLQILGKYTYQENKGSMGQDDAADVEEERAHIMSAELIYDLTSKFQIADKFAYRIAEEKVTGFDFVKTHTWLMIQRLSYKVDKNWLLTGEARMLGVEEAKDYKVGGLFEMARNIGDYAQLGLGYNFTEFTDDLTDLSYSTHGPFIRLTGTLYDRTPEELKRAQQKRTEERIAKWAWALVYDQLSKRNGHITKMCSENLILARQLEKKGDLEEARKIYKDIIVAGEMMYSEAQEYIRDRIGLEERLQQMKVLADQYYKNGRYGKARKILQKIVEEIEGVVLE